MNNFNMSDTRNRRNLLNWTGFFPFQSVANYSTDSSKIKMEIKNSFGENLFINNLHLIPDPLKKNLADSVVTGEVKTKTNMVSETKTFVNEPKRKNCTSASENRADAISGITSFLSGVFSFVSGAMFHKRENSSTQYYDCFEQNYDEQAPSLQAWHIAKPEVQNKNGRAHNVIVSTNETPGNDHVTLNLNTVTAASCENKLKEVCLLLQNQQSQHQSQLLSEHSKKVFREPSVIEDCYEDAFCCDGFESLPNEDFLEYYGPFSHPNFLISDAPRIRNQNMPLNENMEITETLPDIKNHENSHTDKSNNEINDSNENKLQIVSTCEDKMSKLKALLQEKCKNKFKSPMTSSDENVDDVKVKRQQPTSAEPILIPSSNVNNSTDSNVHCISKVFSKYCNGNGPNKQLESQSSMDDLECSDTSVFLDPCNYFDEVTGKFYSTSVDSDDSFQIVFADSPRSCRGRLASECDSEDSFIVFDDSPDSCFSSNDIFGEEIDVDDIESESSSDSSDTENDDSDSESDSDCDAFSQTCKLSHTLSRTIGDLTDDSLYDIDGDEVDCATIFAREKSVESVPNRKQLDESMQCSSLGHKSPLIDEDRKMEKSILPKKTVRFSDKPPKVHVMRVWAFAARQARAGHWERHALDRERFKRRIADVEMAVSWVLKPQHRSRIMFQRFMPWWNAEKRRELAEREANKNENKMEVRDAKNDRKVGQNSESDLKPNEKLDEESKENVSEMYNPTIPNPPPNEDYKSCCRVVNLNGICDTENLERKNFNGVKSPNGIRRNGQVSVLGTNDIRCLKYSQHDDVHVST